MIARSNELGGIPLPLSRPDALLFLLLLPTLLGTALVAWALVACRCRCPGRVSEP